MSAESFYHLWETTSKQAQTFWKKKLTNKQWKFVLCLSVIASVVNDRSIRWAQAYPIQRREWGNDRINKYYSLNNAQERCLQMPFFKEERDSPVFQGHWILRLGVISTLYKSISYKIKCKSSSKSGSLSKVWEGTLKFPVCN